LLVSHPEDKHKAHETVHSSPPPLAPLLLLLLLLVLHLQWAPGCEGGAAQLEVFIQQQLQHFSHRKANVDRCVCSRLSPWIRVGSISVRRIFYRVRHAACGCDLLIGWRVTRLIPS
jgi:deoxyribodipyrimidine photolyase